jgi:hypothetical protein
MRKDYWKKLESAFEQIVGGEVTDSHPLDILHQVLDELEGRVLSFKRKLAPERLLVRICAKDETQGALFRRAFLDEPYLKEAVRQELEELGLAEDKQPEIEIEVAVQPGLFDGKRFVIDEVWKSQSQAGPRRASARLVVVEGVAEATPIEITKDRTTIGRRSDVHNQMGHPIRHNDLAFTEEDPISRTVSRSQAHIEFDARKKQYRLLHDEGSSTTGVLRDGRLIDITKNPRGLLLMPGDVLYFGKARVRFEASD